MSYVKIVGLAAILLLFAAPARSQGTSVDVDSIFSAIHKAALIRSEKLPEGINNVELYRCYLEHSFEMIASTKIMANPSDSIFHAFFVRWSEEDSLHRERVNQLASVLLERGTPQELIEATEILGRNDIKDTVQLWNAYSLANRVAQLGDTSLQQVSTYILVAYIRNHGSRVNADSILASWREQSVQADTSDAIWLSSYPTALTQAKRTRKTILVEFTGYTVTNSRAMEVTILSQKKIRELLQNFVLVRLYTDNGTPENNSNQKMEEERFNTIALPLYTIISPNDKPLAIFPGYTRDAKEFISFLKLEKRFLVKKSN